MGVELPVEAAVAGHGAGVDDGLVEVLADCGAAHAAVMIPKNSVVSARLIPNLLKRIACLLKGAPRAETLQPLVRRDLNPHESLSQWLVHCGVHV